MNLSWSLWDRLTVHLGLGRRHRCPQYRNQVGCVCGLVRRLLAHLRHPRRRVDRRPVDRRRRRPEVHV
jgi:hypothetical protein